MKKSKWLMVPIALLIVVMVIYGYQVVHFQHKFLPNSKINNITVGNMTEKEAASAIKKAMDKETFVLLDNGEPWRQIQKKDLEIQYDIDTSVASTLKKQNPWLWFLPYVAKQESVDLKVTSWDKGKLQQLLASTTEQLGELNKSRIATKNAAIEHDGTQFQIIPEVQGDSLDIPKITAALEKELFTGSDKLELEEFKEVPVITADSQELKNELEQINTIAKINASYTINGNDVSIPSEDIASWIMYKDGKVTLKNDKVRAFVEKLGNTYNTSSNPSTFSSTRRGEVSVPAGAYGWTISTDTETDQLTKLILEGKDFSGRVPAFQGSGSPASPLIGNTYIEVDLQNQHMWYYQNGTLKLDTAVITGKPSTPTPPAVNYVWNKERNATLVGEDYRTPVAYWMPIDWNGVGIHDSPWQPSGAYGGSSYQSIGSHGCVNTPPGVMAQLFEMVEVGTPVIVF